jgi:hypothetical protein
MEGIQDRWAVHDHGRHPVYAYADGGQNLFDHRMGRLAVLVADQGNSQG